MKEVPKKDLPEVSGGDFHEGGCIPYPRLPGTDDGVDYPQNPFGVPASEAPYGIDIYHTEGA
jgi:hypothetical protein